MPDIVEVIRAALREGADPERAPGQQAYMKSEMPFLGVTLPEVRRIVRASASQTADAGILRAAASELWDDATHREERYAAMLLLGLRPTRAQWENVALVEHMVRTGRWWDITDELAHRMAELHDALPRETADLVRLWSTDAELWLRRIAILSQLGRRERVDRALLAELIEPNRLDPDFFIRKAIGWALREYARVDPAWVREYVGRHELSPLSRREALKHLVA